MTTPATSGRQSGMRVFFVLMVTIAAGCSATVYSVRRPDLPCDRALRMTHRTLVALGYDINQMVAPGESGAGFIAGRKPGPNGTTLVGRVDIRCDGRGVTLQPVENGPFSKFEFSRAFDYSFAEAVKRPDLEVPAKAIGLQVLVQRLDRYQAELDLGGTPTTGDAVPVRITVRNHTDRAITIDPTGFRLTRLSLPPVFSRCRRRTPRPSQQQPQTMSQATKMDAAWDDLSSNEGLTITSGLLDRWRFRQINDTAFDFFNRL